MTPIRRKLVIVLAIGAPILLALLYGAAWTILADRWRAGLASWIAAQAENGWTVTTGDMAVTGFPGPIRLTLAQPALRDALGNAWRGPPLTLSISLWRPLTPGFTAAGTHRIVLAGATPVEIVAGGLTGTVTIADRRPVALSAKGENLSGPGIALAGLSLEIDRPPPIADAPVPTLATARLDLDRLTLPPGFPLPLDQTVNAVHVASRLRGAWPDGKGRDALATWRDGGGTIDLDSFDIAWPPLDVAGNATLALDGDLQPELAGTVDVRGGGDAVDRAVAAHMMDKNGAIIAKLALTIASKPTGDGGTAARVPISVQKRVLSLGPVPVWQVPEVTW